MSRDYGALRLWSTVLMFIGILGVIFVLIGVIFATIGAATFWQVLAILLIGDPWPRFSPAGRSLLGRRLGLWPTSPSTSEISSKESPPSG
jgi:hypothetical protein